MKLPIKLPTFYKERLKGSATWSAHTLTGSKIFQKALRGTIDLFISGTNLCITSLCWKTFALVTLERKAH